jgi:1-acyl-sn-glycerol-3-phosphate acyltransferase
MKNPYPINPLLQFGVRIWMSIFTRKYNIKASIPENIKSLDEPYLLLSNHVGRYDPFIVSHFLNKRPNFISSDAILRDRIIGTAFKMLGAMPKKKGVRDSIIIREMVKVIQANGALALFAEGARTWSGKSLYVDPSIAKLVRLLNVPVISATMKGAYAYDPRWAKRIRKTESVKVEYAMVFEKGEARKMSEEDILERINAVSDHDDIEYLIQHPVKIYSDQRAEYIERIIYYCPDCNSHTYFHSSGNTFVCSSCNTKTTIDEFGMFNNTHLQNTRDWVEWENKKWVEDINEKLAKNELESPLLSSLEMNVMKAVGKGNMQAIGKGRISLFHNRIEFNANEKIFSFTLEEIEDLSPQYEERLEMIVGNVAYRFVSINNIEPGIRWEVAINVLWHYHKMDTKLSPFFKELVLSNSPYNN